MGKQKAFVAVIAAIILTTLAFDCRGQRLAVSTNGVYWGMLSPNLNIELALSRHSSISLETAALPWNINNKYSLSHINVSPDYKYWFTMPFYGHFTGVNILYSSYRQIKDNTEKKGNVAAVGALYGYAFLLNSRWNIVPQIGIGCGIDYRDGKSKAIIMPTRLGLNIQMVIK